jgi:putative tricarboxylic transport membrane protein
MTVAQRGVRRPALVRWRSAAAAATVALVATGCSGGASGGDGDGDGGADRINRLQVMAPADPGGGWDQTARAIAAALEGEELVGSARVSNVGGAGGTVGLAELATERSEDFLMVMGLVMVGAIETNQSQATLEDVTPLARLTTEDEIIVVPADSPYQTIDDLVEDVRANGRAVSIAGGSAGGTDHIVAGLLFQAADIPIENLNYVAFSGGGESLAALLGSQVSAGISGVGEYAQQVEAGKLRALAVTGADPVEGIDAPTLTEAGYDVELSNWRGVVAPPNISDEARERLLALVEAMQESETWQSEVEQRGWSDYYLAGDEFEAFLDEERQRVRGVLEDIGLIS